MARRHIVRYPSGKTDEPGIFKPADEERVAAALKAYQKVKWGRDWCLNEKANRRKELYFHVAVGVLGTAVFSGMASLGLEKLVGGANVVSKALWFDAGPAMKYALNEWPGLFALLGAQATAGWALQGVNQGRKKKSQALGAEKVWDTATYKDYELIHVFTRENKLDPAYNHDELYTFKGKPFPAEHIPFSYSAKGERTPLEWTRFTRDGAFNLVVGEYHERDGRYNDQPRLVKIPMSGCVLGVLVIGPTGSGKTQANLLPYLDQFIGYNFWVQSEKDFWLKKVPEELELAKAKLKDTTGKAKTELEARIWSVETEYQKKLATVARGEDFRKGNEKFAGFFWEPKSLEWRTTREMLRRFGREKDYIELGIVPSRFERYKEWTTRLELANRQVWGWTDEAVI